MRDPFNLLLCKVSKLQNSRHNVKTLHQIWDVSAKSAQFHSNICFVEPKFSDLIVKAQLKVFFYYCRLIECNFYCFFTSMF